MVGEKEEDRDEGRQMDKEGKGEFVCLVGWLVGFLASSSSTRLYRGKVERRREYKERFVFKDFFCRT